MPEQLFLDLQKIKDLPIKKLIGLYEQLIIETRPEEKIRLKSLISETKNDLGEIEQLIGNRLAPSVAITPN